MGLFQRTVLKKHLLELNNVEIDAAYKRFTDYFHNPTIQNNIRNSKEEQFQEGFLRELFGHVLNYTLNPNPEFNLTTELKNISDSKKVDGAVVIDSEVRAVIELKGMDTTDLDKWVDYAFRYRNSHDCSYVVLSNFEKLRFYIDNTIDYEEFNLFTLNREQFNLLYLCLSFDNIKNNVPKRLKAESVSQEDQITKKLYKDYSEFKRALFNNLVELNPHYDKLLLFKKTQKLLDRFLFIFFAEDRLLLPTNLIFRINQEWKNLQAMRIQVSLYERYMVYFNDLNHGAKVTLPAFGKKTGEAITAEFEIYAYNGGLFLPDEVLDNVKIDDTILHTYSEKLSNYDFDSDVDVNILGHIFENSLNEIDEIKSEFEGEIVDKTKTKRKKDGVFYTPKYITKYIVDNTLGKLCIEKKTEINLDETQIDESFFKKNRSLSEKGKAFTSKIEEYRKWLLNLKICDPACGSGAFLNQALEFLIQEHTLVDALVLRIQSLQVGGLGQYSTSSKDISDEILESNIYGVDLNEESVEIAKLSLWLRTAQKGRKLNSLNNNIKCGNSLIDDPAVAGDKAFSWEKEFPEVFAKGGFDVVIGNPPYVFARDNFKQDEKDFFVTSYVSAKYQINTYLLFIEKTIHILKEKGVHGLIIPNSWLMMYSGEGLRKYLLETNKLYQIINLAGYSFESANVETVILLAKKEKINSNKVEILLNNGNEFYFSHSKDQSEFAKNKGFEFKVFSDEISDNLNIKFAINSKDLDELVDIKAGLQAYEKGKGDPIQNEEDVKNRPYDYNYPFDESTFKYLDGKDVCRYYSNWSGAYLRYGKHLAAPRTINLFNGKKIIVREITGKFPKCIIATYNEEMFLYNRSNIAIVEKQNTTVSLKFILALLNSKLLSYYFLKNTAKSVRKLFPKIILNDLRKFPIRLIKFEDQQPFIDLANVMLLNHSRFLTSNKNFISFFSSQLSFDQVSNNLTSWHELNFSDFIKEINKSIKSSGNIPLNKLQEMEWMEVFETRKKELLELKAEIDKTDKEIDQLVYALYGLNEEEIRIVEGA
jgi:type I restriction-modification system DNA methylase subunit